ncbi:MAG TPA: trypsin-like peptidase domain-containing protein [Herpetosiphonaceae bacterium]
MLEQESVTGATLLSRAISDGLAGLIGKVQDSVVQVRSGRRGSGSGIVWRSDGIVMTNHHVVGSREHVSVLFNDDREIQARVIARDPVLDLAALSVDAIGLPAAEIGVSSTLRVGELVLAVGNPWGQRGVVTAGIISAVGEIETSWRSGKAEYIRSDVRLAPGNSGGPLLDAQGRVIGVNAMIFGGDLGVAIPSHIATQFLLVAEGQRPMLGVGVQPVPLPASFQALAQRDRGLLVVELLSGGAAERAGFYIGDVLLDVAGKPVLDGHSLTYALAEHRAGDAVGVRYLRGGEIRDADVALDAFPAQRVAA